MKWTYIGIMIFDISLDLVTRPLQVCVLGQGHQTWIGLVNGRFCWQTVAPYSTNLNKNKSSAIRTLMKPNENVWESERERKRSGAYHKCFMFQASLLYPSTVRLYLHGSSSRTRPERGMCNAVEWNLIVANHWWPRDINPIHISFGFSISHPNTSGF